MYISTNWIKEYTRLDLTTEELVENIATKVGSVEEVVDLSKKYEGIITAEIVGKKDHPNADKLGIYTLNIGDGKQVQVVAGDKTLEVGDKVAYFSPGVKVPYNAHPEKYDGIVSKVSLRGVDSEGMMASARELDFGSDHTMVMRLDNSTKAGENFAQLFGLNDILLDVENKALANRGDLFGIVGLAREISAIQGMPFKAPEWSTATDYSNLSGDTPITVDNQIEAYCKRYMAIAMDSVTVKQSPTWLKATLAKVGIRPINNIVDITNYMMYLTSQPLHAFDLDKVLEKSKRSNPAITVRLAREGESITTLDSKTVTLDVNSMVITDGDSPIAIAGIIGGQDTEIDENTKRIIIESANFDRYNIRKTSMRLGLFTDAVTRFTKAQDPSQCAPVLLQTVNLVKEIAGGKVASTVADDYRQPIEPKILSLGIERLNTVLGTELTIQAVGTLLTNLEYGVEIEGSNLKVTVPTFRQDIDIAEDLYEDVGRHFGYNNIKITLPNRSIEPNRVNTMLEFKGKIRDILTKLGGNELLTYNFTDSKVFEKYGLDTGEAYKITNPLSPELEYMRYDLLPSLLEKAIFNIEQGYPNFILYEVNKGHSKNEQDQDVEEKLPKEREYLGVVTVNPEYSGNSYYVSKALLEKILVSLNVKTYDLVLLKDIEEGKARWVDRLRSMLDINRSAVLVINEECVGVVGQLESNIQRNSKLPTYTSVLELDLNLLQPYTKDSYGYVEPSRYPKTVQDFCFELPVTTSYEELYRLVKKVVTDVDYVFTISPLDIFHKEEDTMKKITLRLELQHRDRTLTQYDITQLRGTLSKESEGIGGRIV